MKKLALVLASAMALTSAVALADEPAPTPAPVAATPLQTRQSKPLAFVPANEGTPLGYKLLAGGVVVAAAIVYVKKKKSGGVSKTKKTSSIDVLARSSIGVRNELLVIDVEGTRLLVGMTPGSMQTLAVLQTPEGVVGEESPFMGEEAYMADEPPEAVPVGPRAMSAKVLRDEPEAAEEPDDEVEELSDRVRSLLAARKKKAESEHETRAPRVASSGRRAPQPAFGRARVPGQAKGLLLSMQDTSDREDRSVTKLGDW